MQDTYRLYFYKTTTGVRVKTTVDKQLLVAVARDRDTAREEIIAKIKEVLTDHADQVEDVEINF